MYNLPYFKEEDPAEVLKFIRSHPFPFVCGSDSAGRPVATQLPLLLEEREGGLFLLGHLMRNTDHHKALERNAQVLCVFTGAHSYVSARWYANPAQASTWNYQSVHVRGEVRFLDRQGLETVLRKTSLHFEGHNAGSPTVFDNLAADYTARLLPAIVGFEIHVTGIDNVFKLSQNRDAESYGHIINHLQEGDADAKAVAAAMKQRQAALFSGSTRRKND